MSQLRNKRDYVDEFGKDAVYKNLERAYDEAEAVIPFVKTGRFDK